MAGAEVLLEVDTSAMTQSFMCVAFSIDGSLLEKKLLPHGEPCARVKLATPLIPPVSPPDAEVSDSDGEARAVHSLVVLVQSSVQQFDRWGRSADKPPACSLRLRAIELLLPQGCSAVPPDLRPRRVLAFGCSITEGVCTSVEPGGTRGGDLGCNAASETWVAALARSLDAEYGSVGFGRQGWCVEGNGGVPAFHPVTTPAGAYEEDQMGAAAGSWAWAWTGRPRDFGGGGDGSGGGRLAIPDFIVIVHGTNDGLAHSSAEVVARSVASWLRAARARLGGSPRLFLCVPFGGFGGPSQPPAGALADGFARYQSLTPDTKAHLVDLGPEATLHLTEFRILNGRYDPTAESCDGIHPTGERQRQLGTRLAAIISELSRDEGPGE
jgi:lysophospholipase L1-like esterase